MFTTTPNPIRTDMRSVNVQSRYDEPQYLADIEEHLGVTIQQADTDMKVKADEFDGKVVYRDNTTLHPK